MKLSVILIAYDMAREIPRTLQGLSRTYQHGAQELDYEVILVDNGSPESSRSGFLGRNRCSGPLDPTQRCVIISRQSD